LIKLTGLDVAVATAGGATVGSGAEVGGTFVGNSTAVGNGNAVVVGFTVVTRLQALIRRRRDPPITMFMIVFFIFHLIYSDKGQLLHLSAADLI
jgi:hypothetical protein